MKTLFLTLFLLLTSIGFGQQTEDSTIICIPTEIGKRILIDLNELDKVRVELKLCDEEVKQLELKIQKKDSIIGTQVEKEKNLNNIIVLKDEQVKLLKGENDNLRSDIGKLKTKNTITQIVAGGIIGGLIYIFAFK